MIPPLVQHDASLAQDFQLMLAVQDYNTDKNVMCSVSVTVLIIFVMLPVIIVLVMAFILIITTMNCYFTLSHGILIGCSPRMGYCI